MLNLWSMLVGCATLLGIVVTAFEVMLQSVEASEGMRRVGMLLGCAALLSILPQIIVGIWSGLSVWQKLGILGLVGMVAAILASRKHPVRHEKGGRK